MRVINSNFPNVERRHGFRFYTVLSLAVASVSSFLFGYFLQMMVL